MWGMKQIFILLSLLVLFVGCNGVTHNAADLPVSGNTGNPVSEIVYSMIFGGNPNAYQGFILRDNGTFEMNGTASNAGNLDGWVKAEGTYSISGGRIYFNATVTGKGNYPSSACADSLVFDYDYAEGSDSIIMAGGAYTLVDEAVSGISMQDISGIPNECP